MWMFVFTPKLGINQILAQFGIEGPLWLMDTKGFIILPMWVIASVSLWQYVGQSMMLYMAQISGISNSLYEASYIDGCTKAQSFRYITLPLIRPMVATAMSLNAIGSLKFFDLIFPHHENEIAQSEAANGKPFAKYWMHNGFLNIDNKKMSKSLGNFFTVRDIGEKYDLQILRFFMLSAHYRSPLNFSAELMEAAKNGLERIVTCVSNLNFLLEKAKDGEMGAAEKELADQAAEFAKKFDEAMDDDFNTADAISAIFELVKFANTNVNEESGAAFIGTLKEQILELTDICGLTVESGQEMLDSEIESLIAERQEARKARNFARADEIRDILTQKGIILEDTREGVKWKRA